MRIDYCPKCGKAGLRQKDNNMTPMWKRQNFPDGTEAPKYEKWCPRCKEWVVPENHPYVGTRGVS